MPSHRQIVLAQQDSAPSASLREMSSKLDDGVLHDTGKGTPLVSEGSYSRNILPSLFLTVLLHSPSGAKS